MKVKCKWSDTLNYFFILWELTSAGCIFDSNMISLVLGAENRFIRYLQASYVIISASDCVISDPLLKQKIQKRKKCI